MGDLNKHTKKYEFKADNVIELLKELKAKFEDDKVESTKSETASINAYDLAKAARDDAIAAAKAIVRRLLLIIMIIIIINYYYNSIIIIV